MSRRSETITLQYKTYLQSNPIPFVENPVIQEYTHWKIVSNMFPYDLTFEKHDLLIPKDAQGSFRKLSPAAQQEYHVILSKLEGIYDMYFVNMPKGRTVPTHWHCHLATWKERT
jgi:hypothetical protein